MRYSELNVGSAIRILGVGLTLFFSVTPLRAQACFPAPSDLVAWWPGDGDATDVAGGNDGTVLGGVAFPSGLVEQAFGLDGVDDFVSVPNAPVLNPNALTVVAWYQTTSFAGNGNNSIVDKGYVGDSPPYYQYHLGVTGDQYVNSPGAFQFWVAAGGQVADVRTTPGFWSPGQWYHLVGTYDGTAVKLYVDGALVASRSASGSVADYGNPLLIGAFSYLNRPSIDFTPGTIDEVALFNRALSASEIQAIHDAGTAGMCKDEDGDGFRPPEDCDETSAAINPNAVELPGNFVDENCDGNLGECDPCLTWRSHGEYVRCVSGDVEALVAAVVFTEEVGDALVGSAARSDVGKKGFVPAECQP